MAVRINCYLVEVNDFGQIQSADLMYSETGSDGNVFDPKLDRFMFDSYSATLHSVYFHTFISQMNNNKSAEVLRFYKNH